MICDVRVSPWKAGRPPRSMLRWIAEVFQAIDFAEQDARAQRARAVVDLGLRQVERVLALDVARRDVVADAKADDLAVRVHDQRQLGLGHVPGAVGAHADRLLVADDAPADRLQEHLGALGFVDARVDVLDRRLGLARLAAAQVGHAAGPHFLRRLDRRQQLAGRRGAARQRAKEVGQVGPRQLEQQLEPQLRRQESVVERPAGAALGGLVAGEQHRARLAPNGGRRLSQGLPSP